MKKICFITTVPITIRVFLLGLIEYFHEETDWDISVICNPEADFASGLPQHVHFFPVAMERGISIGGIKAMLQIKKIFNRERFDLIQFSTPNAAFYSALAGSMARIPVRLYCQWGMAYKGFHGLKRAVFKTVEKIICSLSTVIEPDSQSNLEFAVSEGLYTREKAHVVWNGSASGVNLIRFDPKKQEGYRQVIREQYGIPEERFVFVFVGRVTRDKGVNELFGAFEAVTKESDVHLLVIGPNEINESVDVKLYEWSLAQPNITYVGYTDEVPRFLAASDCYVLPSYHEGFGMSIIEAEAMGLPVIVTDIPGPKNAMINGVTGISVRKADTDELKNAMLKLYHDRELATALGQAGREFAVSHFDQQILFKHLLDDRMELMKAADIAGRKK